MGFPPPPAGPSPSSLAQTKLSASFAASPPVASLCGFALPSFAFAIGFVLPTIFPLPIPVFSISIGLNCSLTNPLDVSAGLSYGGGRVASSDPDPDAQLLEAA